MIKYWISEIFVSLQGEGEVIGTPSNFIRFAGCHLRCIWCDTKYAWHRYDGKLMSLNDILNNIDRDLKFTTITGGEPLLNDLLPLVRELKKLDHKVLVETSGTIRPPSVLRDYVDIFSVSPKLSNSGYKIKYNFKNEDWVTYFKFVIVDPERDVKEVMKFVEENNIDPRKVILQPDGTAKDYISLMKKLVEVVLEYKVPFRVIPQIHRIIGIR